MNRTPRLLRLLPPSTLRHGLRTALAATLAALLTRVLHLDQGYWAVFSVVIVMQADFGSSIAAGWTRLLGTAAGAVLGALAASAVDRVLGPGMPALAAAMLVSTFFCALLAAKNANFRLAGLTSAVVICLHSQGDGPAFSIALSRFLEVSLGIVVALGVSVAWPSRAAVVLRFGLGKGLEHIAALLGAIMNALSRGEYDRPRVFHRKDAVLRLSLRNRQLLDSSRREPGNAELRERQAGLLALQSRLAEHMLAMDHALESCAGGGGFRDIMGGELARLGSALNLSLVDLGRAVRENGVPASSALSGLDEALRDCGERLLELRRARVLADYELDDVLHLYSFYNALREAARETRAECARRLDGAAS